MNDIGFDIEKREVILKDGDFFIADNPSVQNGGIILETKNAFVSNPTLGVGILGVMGAPVSQVSFEMNRWKSQCLNDGAKKASYKIIATNNDYSEIKITTDISYE